MSQCHYQKCRLTEILGTTYNLQTKIVPLGVDFLLPPVEHYFHKQCSGQIISV